MSFGSGGGKLAALIPAKGKTSALVDSSQQARRRFGHYMVRNPQLNKLFKHLVL